MAQSIIENGKKLESTIDFSNFTKELKKYRLRVLLVVLGVTLVALPLIYSMTPQYSATATVVLKAQSDNSTPIDQVEDFDATQAEYYPTQVEVMQSKQVIEATVRTLDLQHDPLFEIKDTDKTVSEEEHIQQIVTAISKKLSISPVRFSQLVKMSYESTSPEMSAKIANAIVETYIQLEEERKIK